MTEIGAQEAALAAKKAQDNDLVAFKQSMDRLKADLSPGPNAKQKLRKACTDFEAVFISKLWEQMRATVPKSGMFNSQQEEMYRSMFDREFTEKMAQDGGIGLGDMLYNQLKDKIKGGGKAGGATGAQALQTPVGQLSTGKNSSLEPGTTGAVPQKPEFKSPRRGSGLTPQAAGAVSQVAQPAAPAAAAQATVTPAAISQAPRPPASVPGAVMADVEALARRIEAAYDERQASQAGQAASAEQGRQEQAAAQSQAAAQGKARYGRTLRGESGIAGRRFATIG